MPIYAPDNGGGTFTPIAAGAYPAVLSSLIDLGYQPNKNPAYLPAHRIVMLFQIPSQRQDDGRAHEVPQQFTYSVNKKANMRKFIESWAGKSFSDEAIKKFDLERLLKKPAFVNIVHNQVGDKTYANIATIMPLPQGMVEPVLEGEPLIYFIDNPEYAANYGRVPGWLQKKIENRVAKPEKKPIPAGLLGDREPGADDDIPF